MIDEIKKSLAVSLFFENAINLYLATNYVHKNTKPAPKPPNDMFAYNARTIHFDEEFNSILEYSRNVLRYTEIVREFIGSYNLILKKYIDLHFFRDGYVYISDFGERIFHDPQLILKYEHLVLMQKSLFEGHPIELLLGYFKSVRKTEFQQYTTLKLNKYIKPFLIPIRNMIAHPTGNRSYISNQDWIVRRDNTRLTLEIKINDNIDIGSYNNRDLSEIWEHQITNSLEILDKIIELIIAEMAERYEGFQEADIRFSKYIKGKTPNSVSHINEDLLKIDFNAFELTFI